MASFQEQILQINKLRDVYDKADKAFYEQKLAVQQKVKPESFETVAADLRERNAQYQNSKLELNKAISILHAVSPRQLTKELDSNLPIMLLPVRIETRFVNAPVSNGPELWLRIFPDDIHNNTHEPILTEKEYNAGMAYWQNFANLKVGNSTEEKKKDNWSDFKLTVTGAQRALWVAKKTKPTNWADTNLQVPGELVFPNPESLKQHTWTQAPHTQAMPDRFVVTIFKNDKPVFEQIGATIADTVFLGPDPFMAEEAFKKEGDDIKFHEDIEWLQNFDKAVALGLGLKISLTPPLLGANNVIERITVLGIMHSADATKSSQIVENLFENHHYSNNGLSLLAQGTPTNNTEKDDSGYTKNEDTLTKGYYEGNPILAVDSNKDIANLANILGINFQVFGDINNVDLAEHSESLAFNKALYASTLSYFFNELMNPTVKPADAKQIRSFFTNFVSARGPLPAIRVGDQPYGILLSSDLGRWSEGPGKNFFNGYAEVMRKLQNVWDQLAKSKSLKVGMPGNTSEILLKILGLQAGSVAFRQRLGNLPDFSYSLPNVSIDTFNLEIKNLNQRIVDFLSTLGFNPVADGNFYPLISNLIFYNWTNDISAKKLVSPDKHTSENPFLPKLPHSNLNYIEWIAKKSNVSALENINFDGDTPPRTLLSLWLRHAMLTELKHSTIKYLNDNKVAVSSATFEKSLFNFNKEAADLSTYELLRADPKKINDQKFRGVTTGIADFLLSDRTFQITNPELGEMRKAMAQISSLPVAKLEKYLGQFIDLCSYRLDAWQTGLFTRRAQTNRKIRPQGLFIGAYGWVENLKSETHISIATDTIPEKLRPDNGKPIVKLKENAGFSHLPSLNHATAAGLLMAGYHNHANSTKPEMFAINLSSERTRKALALFEGIQNGQQLEVLLGYQFERALHDATSSNPANNLNIYIQIFRDKYEIQHISVPQQGAPEAQETIDTYPVCNGLKIQRASDAEIIALINPAHKNQILKIRDSLSDILDACNDLLLTEGAYQITQGNRDRTAGLTNSALFADTPPEIQVVDTLRSSLLTYTHKVSLHFSTGANLPQPEGWENITSPRAIAEPGLNHWLATVIGNPQNILCRVIAFDAENPEIFADFVSLSQLNLPAIDLVYLMSEDLAGGATELEGRLAFVFRQNAAIDLAQSVKIEFKPLGIGVGNKTISQVYPILRQLKQLVTNSRVADALDFVSKTKEVNANPQAKGIDFVELSNRLKAVLDILKTNLEAFNQIAPNNLAEIDENNPASFKEFFERIISEGGESDKIKAIELDENALNEIQNFQIMASSFGIQLAYPENLNLSTLKNRADLLKQNFGNDIKNESILAENKLKADLLSKTFNTWKVINEKIKIAENRLTAFLVETESFPKNKLLTEAAKAILGDDFVIIPQFKYINSQEINQTFADTDQLLKSGIEKTLLDQNTLLNSWVQSVSRVRPEMDRFEKLRMMAEAGSEQEIDLQAIQIPFRKEDSWLGFELPELYEGKPFNILSDTLSLAVHGKWANNVDELQSVLVVDEWTEKIPIDNEITGVAYHYNQPNAMAPQSLIVAVEPTGAPKWDWDVLQGVLNDTLRRAKTRAVEPDHLMENEAMRVLLPMTVASFDVNETNISLDYLTLSDKFMTTIKSSNLPLYQKWSKTV
jgi:hypothetical protein